MERIRWETEGGPEDRQVIDIHFEFWSMGNAIDLGFPGLIEGDETRCVAVGLNAHSRIIRAFVMEDVSFRRYLDEPKYRELVVQKCQEMFGFGS